MLSLIQFFVVVVVVVFEKNVFIMEQRASVQSRPFVSSDSQAIILQTIKGWKKRDKKTQKLKKNPY